MYKRASIIYSKNTSISDYIENNDTYNSKLLLDISDPSIEREEYIITVNKYRPDLIAEEFYGNSSYLDFIILQTGRRLEDFGEGEILYLIPKNVIDSLISNL